jgi:3'-phosphoadenosine 5'-phosphosulfate sulfotransferase
MLTSDCRTRITGSTALDIQMEVVRGSMTTAVIREHLVRESRITALISQFSFTRANINAGVAYALAVRTRLPQSEAGLKRSKYSTTTRDGETNVVA